MSVATKPIPLFGVVHLPEMEAATLEVLRSGSIANGGYVTKFEESLGQILGQKNVVTTVDMTAAMQMALHLADVGEGDEVLTLAFACLSTNSAIAQRKAKPIWVDLAPNSIEMSIDDLISKITNRTKAIILYHVAGYPGPAKTIAEVCIQHGITLIEDCNNALLASKGGVMVGSHGDFSVYSFYPNRQINTTEGGALVCKDPEDATRARKLRRFGINPDTFRHEGGEINPTSAVSEIGWSVTLSNLCSAIGMSQVKTLQERVDATRVNAASFEAGLKKINGLRSVPYQSNDRPSFWVFLLFVEQRDQMLVHLKKAGINASGLHMRNDIYTGFGAHKSWLINTDYVQNHLLAIPCGWWLNSHDVELVIKTIEKYSIK